MLKNQAYFRPLKGHFMPYHEILFNYHEVTSTRFVIAPKHTGQDRN